MQPREGKLNDILYYRHFLLCLSFSIFLVTKKYSSISYYRMKFLSSRTDIWNLKNAIKFRNELFTTFRHNAKKLRS